MSLSSALQIGKSALIAYQQALQLTGNNIANAANPIFSRQTARFSPLAGANSSGVQIGTGVQVVDVQRRVQEALESRLRTAGSDRDARLTQRTALDRVEAVYDALGDDNIGTALSELFKSFSDLQNSPDDDATRGVVVRRGVALADSIQKARSDIINLREDLNDDITALTGRADELAGQIADLNVQITAALAGGGAGKAAGLQDQRGALLSELAGLINITTRETQDGSINVFIANDPLVLGGISRGLKTTLEPIGDALTRAVVRFTDDNGQVTVRSGQIAGAIEARDAGAATHYDRLNRLASAVIQEVNKRHAGGQGLSAFTGLTGNYAVLDPAAALNLDAAGLDLRPQSGSFYVNLKDKATGLVTKYQINVDLDGLNGNDTTLNSLAAQINAVLGGNVTATVQADGRLNLSAAAGYEFTFGDDRSNVLAALGLNTFFVGSDARDVAVSDLVLDDPNYVAAAFNGLPGDGENAGRLVAAGDAASTLLGGASIVAYYQSSVSRSAVDANAAGNALSAAQVIVDGLTAQHESISGVNLDEEAVKLVTFQRSYQGAAQYLTVVDEMLQTLLSLVR